MWIWSHSAVAAQALRRWRAGSSSCLTCFWRLLIEPVFELAWPWIRNVKSGRHPEQWDALGWFLSSELVMLSVCARCLVFSFDVSFCARQPRLSMTAMKNWSLLSLRTSLSHLHMLIWLQMLVAWSWPWLLLLLSCTNISYSRRINWSPWMQFQNFTSSRRISWHEPRCRNVYSVTHM